MDIDKSRLVELVTKEVMRVLSSGSSEPAKPGHPPALVAGDPSLLPASIAGRISACNLDAYTCAEDADRFDKMYLTELGQTDLADIALGRTSGKVSCAVCSMLLRGKEVWLLESALTFRKYGATAPRALLMTLEGYVRTLRNYGVKLFDGKTALNKYTAAPMPDPGLPEGIINEAVARRLVNAAEGDSIRIKKGSVITPSARDVIKDAHKRLEIVEEV